MSKLRIANNLRLPLDTVTQSLAILAKRRAGKSYTGRRFAEELLAAEQQVVIVDPKGDWWGIRSGADGKTPGFPIVVLGGEHGDLPLEQTAAETVARLIVEERVSILLDLSSFRKSEVAFFMGGDLHRRHDGLLEILYRLKAKDEFRTPVMLITDEADAIAPQKPYQGEERMLGAMEDIVRRGGQRGIGSLLISQRSAVLNKNVLTQTQVMIAMRTIAEQDLDAIMGWVDVHGVPEQAKVLKASLPSLPIGDAWILSPGWPTDAGIFERIHVDSIKTFDSGATPKAGAKPIKPKNLADVDLAALQQRMAETIERAKAADPKELHKQLAAAQKKIAELERYDKNRISQKRDIPPGDVAAGRKVDGQKQYERGYIDGAKAQQHQYAKTQASVDKQLLGLARETKGLNAQLEKELLRTTEHLGFAAQAFNGMQELARRTAASWAELTKTEPPALLLRMGVQEVEQEAFGKPKPEPVAPRREPREPTELQDGITGPQQRILDAIAYANLVGFAQPGNSMVALLADYSSTSTSYTNPRGELRKLGLIDYPALGKLILTPEGRDKANSDSPPSSTKELQSRVLARLPGPESKILRVLIDHYPKALSNEECAGQAGYSPTSTSYTNPRGALRSIGLIDLPTKGMVVAVPALFLKDQWETA